MKFQKISFYLFLFCCIIATWTPSSHIPKADIFSFDKVIHFSIFLILGLLYPYRRSKLIIDAIFYSPLILYGILSEFIQKYIPGRSPSFYDELANLSGLFLAFILIRAYKGYYELQSNA